MLSTDILQKLKENISNVIIGNEHTIELLLTCLLARGHVLLEDVPGTGKTVMAKSLAKSIAGSFGRIQFTPDMLPSDVTGLNYFDSKKNEFVFAKGPVFCNILLADEINRATPKTQSSLLECMAERQVTVDGVTRKLEEPFLVIATQNPLETLGTFPLPEAQMDRFLMQISMEELSEDQELAMIHRFVPCSNGVYGDGESRLNDTGYEAEKFESRLNDTGYSDIERSRKSEQNPLDILNPICSKEELVQLQDDCSRIYIYEDLLSYMVKVIHATRQHSRVDCGVSPRGTLALVRASQAYAMVQGRDYVVPEDIKAVAVPVLAHRLTLTMAADGRRAARAVIEQVLQMTDLPTEEWKR